MLPFLLNTNTLTPLSPPSSTLENLRDLLSEEQPFLDLKVSLWVSLPNTSLETLTLPNSRPSKPPLLTTPRTLTSMHSGKKKRNLMMIKILTFFIGD
jgi:hypothetical protein